MTSITITTRDRRILPWVALAVGLLLTALDLFGVWLQGPFYHGGFPTPATFGEVRLAFTCPTAITTLGSLMVSGVVLTSSITVSWLPRRRLLIFVCFGVLVLMCCAVCGHLAARQVAGILN